MAIPPLKGSAPFNPNPGVVLTNNSSTYGYSINCDGSTPCGRSLGSGTMRTNAQSSNSCNEAGARAVTPATAELSRVLKNGDTGGAPAYYGPQGSLNNSNGNGPASSMGEGETPMRSPFAPGAGGNPPAEDSAKRAEQAQESIQKGAHTPISNSTNNRLSPTELDSQQEDQFDRMILQDLGLEDFPSKRGEVLKIIQEKLNSNDKINDFLFKLNVEYNKKKLQQQQQQQQPLPPITSGQFMNIYSNYNTSSRKK